MTRRDLPSGPVVERYLAAVRRSLRGMPEAEVEEILRELRAHIVERSGPGSDPEAAIRTLGDPDELARQYRGERVAARMECSRSPIVILYGMLVLRGRGVAGWTALALATFGYAWAIVLGAAGIDKILSPRDVGVWIRPGSWLPRLMVDGPGPPGTREILGWWMVPAGMLGCVLLVFLTRRFGLWWIHRSRAARAESDGL
jgi:HAAS domain-containing protein